MPKLLLKFEAAVIREIPFDKPALTVGRKADNDVVIDNPAVSGHHCRISVQGGICFVEDLDSTNGTFVNGKRVKKAGLHHNDVLGVARHSLVFVEDQPAKPVAPPADPPRAEPAAAAEPPAPAKAKAESGPLGRLRVLQGAADQKTEYDLGVASTYIGKSDRAQIPIKGSGLFGSAPEVAASIHRKADGYVLVAVVDGYPSVNGSPVSGSVPLKEGDLIECGATTMQFGLRPGPGS